MKVDTPQILWHCSGSDGGMSSSGKPAALYSVSFLPSSDKSSSCCPPNKKTNGSAVVEYEVLATAGNTPEIHLWKLDTSSPPPAPTTQTSQTRPSSSNATENEEETKRRILHASKTPSIVHHLTLSARHERTINTLEFSPRGTHLASAGDGGSLVIYSVPHSHRQQTQQTPPTSNKKSQYTPEYYWNHVVKEEKDLNSKIISTHAEDIMDISWSRGESRLVVGSLDHTVMIFQSSSASASASASSGGGGASIAGVDANANITSGSNGIGTNNPTPSSPDTWNCIYRNTKEHSHYVQGVAFDPLGTYFASQGSDRTVRVWSRKPDAGGGSNQSSCNGNGGGSKKKILSTVDSNKKPTSTSNSSHESKAMHTRQSQKDSIKFEVQSKAKLLKYRSESSTTSTSKEEDTTDRTTTTSSSLATAPKKHHLFADESTVESFFRRLAWTTDGAFLITPASLWQKRNTNVSVENSAAGSSTTASSSSSSPSFATYLFARHHFDQPYRVLSGMDKPSVVVRPNPVLFQLPKEEEQNIKENINKNNASSSSTSTASLPKPTNNDTKWSQAVTSTTAPNSPSLLPYRSIFAVLTTDTVYIYDSYHMKPLCLARGLHYAGLTDCCWSSNGRSLIVSSTDGYISIFTFGDGELGQVYIPPPCSSSGSVDAVTYNVESNTIEVGEDEEEVVGNNEDSLVSKVEKIVKDTPSCDDADQSSKLIAPPTKKVKTNDTRKSEKMERRGSAKHAISKKKRIAPTLIGDVKTGGDGANEDDNSNNNEAKPLSPSRGLKRVAESDNSKTDEMGEQDGCQPTSDAVDKEVLGGVTNLSIQSKMPQKKKKRVQPTLLSCGK